MDIKETLGGLKDKAEEALKNENIKEKVEGVLDKTDVDDKIKEKVDDIKGKFGK